MNHTAAVRITQGDHARFRALTGIDRMASAFKAVETWRQRHKTRRQLAAADARILKDVGISEAQRFIESNKPFWEK
jgi:uncharacterized protein YjiS (DUF1127 family)